MSTTHQIYIEPSAMVVGVSDEQLVLCHEVIGGAGLRVQRVNGLAAACESVAKALPQVVVVSGALGDVSTLEDRAIAVGAVFVVLGDHDYAAIETELAGAVAVARERFGRRR